MSPEHIQEPEAHKGPMLSRVKGLFLDKKFLHYTWIGLFISGLNVFLLWLFIDVLNIPTVISSVIVIGATFVIRYFLYIFSNMI